MMNSSGIKRGLAATAISALAVTGIPFLANSASATPIIDQVGPGVTILSQGYTLPGGSSTYSNTATVSNDGQNQTISLVAAASSGISSVQFQYRITGSPDQTWKNINAVLGRDGNGVFATEWASTATDGQIVELRAVPNTGEANATYDSFEVEVNDHAVELSTEGALGMYHNLLDNDFNVAVRGTVRANGDAAPDASVDVYDTIRDTVGVSAPATYTSGNGVFAGVLEYAPADYPFSGGSEANQVALTANADATEDTEASTYYAQSVASVTATAGQNPVPTGDDTDVTVTVVDGQGKPVGGARVGFIGPDGIDPGTDPDDNANYGDTDGNGKITLTNLGKGTYTVYADADAVAGKSAGDVSATALTITEYTPVNTGLEATSVAGFTNFDLDELTGGDDFVATFKDQQGNPRVGEPVEYSYTFQPDGGGAPSTSAYAPAGVTNAQGKIAIPFTGVASGSYTLNVRRPNVLGTGLLQGTPLTFNAGESEIEWADGNSVQSPVNGSDTYQGKLALTGAGGAALGGREVTVTYNPNGDVVMSTTQPAGTVRDNSTTATATTAADGTFSVSLTDAPVPPNVTPTKETGTLLADATALSGVGDAANADAKDSLDVVFDVAPEVSRVVVDDSSVFGGDYAPGKPVELDITVFGKDGDQNPANDPELQDFPVTVSVNKGFLTEDTQGAGLNVSANDLVLEADNDDAGDLFGFYESLGAEEQIDTSDDVASSAGIVAAIEKDAEFNIDGTTNMTVTVKAGTVTQTETVEFDARNYLNITATALRRSQGSQTADVQVPGEVDFKLYAVDQFENLVGGLGTMVSDNTPVADVDTDGGFGGTTTDLINDNAGITASSSAPVLQTITAAMNVDENLVDAAGNLDNGSTTATTSANVNWVVVDNPKTPIEAVLKGKNNGAEKDTLKVVTKGQNKADGAVAKLFKIVGGKKVLAGTKTLNAEGRATFVKADKNGKGFTKYFVKVGTTSDTKGDRSPTISVR